MEQFPNSYGTGRDPQKQDSHLLSIALLLLCCAFIHGLTFSYLFQKPAPAREERPTLALEGFAESLAPEHETVEDRCGLGLTLSELSGVEKRFWSLPEGVFIQQVDPQGKAYAAGLRSGDLLMEIGGHSVSSTEDCLSRLESAKGSLTLTYYREGRQYTVSIPNGDISS